jgi:hypothetical protein
VGNWLRDLADSPQGVREAVLSTLVVSSASAWCPDLGPPVPQPADFYLRIENEAFTYLAPGFTSFGRLPRELLTRLHGRVVAALAEPGGELGIDTATGRTITSLEVQLRGSSGGVRTTCYGVNHYGSACAGPAAWRLVLEELLEHLASDLDPAGRELMAFLASRFRVPPPGTGFDEGAVIECPRAAVVRVPLGSGGVLLRVGQREGSRGLYRVTTSFQEVRIVSLHGEEHPVAALPLATRGAAWTPRADHPDAGQLAVSLPTGRDEHGWVLVDATGSSQGLFLQRSPGG